VVLKEIKEYLRPDTCLISIAAGVSMDRLRELTDNACPVVRVMPNTPALVGKGVFALCLDDDRLSAANRTFVTGLLEHMGATYVLEERLFDAFTGLIGSGPAYLFYVMEGLIDAGVSLGLGRQESTEMVKGLFTGSALMAEKSPMHITQLKEMVTSPGGTTIAGLNKLEKYGVKHALFKGVKAAHDRSRKLG
jgi:pyrroline-5-carboxylate reductase